MLLSSSSKNQSKTSTLGEEAMDFFKLSVIKHKHIHLYIIMDSKIMRFLVLHAIANAIFCSAFKWTNLAVPSGVSTSSPETELYL